MNVTARSRSVFDVLGRHVGQVGIVVADLNEALKAYHGVGPWAVWTYDRSTVRDLHTSEGPADFRFRIALNDDDPQIELIQPLDDHSLYAHWLADGHGGLHHLGYLVDNLGAAIDAMLAASFTVLAGGWGTGADGSGGFCYFDTIDAIGYIAEAIERPSRRRQPDFTSP
jgi:hypothetical protein